MKEKLKKSVLVQWIFPACVFFSTIAIILYNYAITDSKAVNKTIKSTFLTSAKYYNASVTKELIYLEKLTSSIADLVNIRENTSQTVAKLNAICNNTNAEMAYFVDLKGRGVREDGSQILISPEKFLTDLDYGKGNIVFQSSDYIGKKASILITAPVYEEGVVCGAILVVLDPETLFDHAFTSDYDTDTWYALMSSDGLITSSQCHGQKFLEPGSDFFGYMDENFTNRSDYAKFGKLVSMNQSGIMENSFDDKKTYVVYTPAGLEEWYFLMGISDDYVTTRQKNSWAPTRDLVFSLIAMLGLFLVTVVVINLLNRAKLYKESKDLEEKAETDLLTELYNKISTEQKITEYIQKHPKQQSVMFVLDIDNFKKINDTMGHAFGDEVLRALGLGLRAEFKVADIVGRTGGDEFIIFLKDLRDADAVKTASDRLIRFFKNFQVGEYVKYTATASIGGVNYPEDADTFEKLYKAADQALYLAKKRGKNQIAFYREIGENMDEKS